MAIELTTRHKKIIKWAGYPLLALVTFVLALSYSFPYARLKDKLENLGGSGVDVEIASIGPTLWPGGVVVRSMSVELEADDDANGEQSGDVHSIFVDEARVRAGLLSLLTGRGKVSVDAVVGDGSIRGDVRYGRGGVKASLRTRQLPLDRLPVERALLPMTGSLELDASLELPDMQFADAQGFLTLQCKNCTVGDGEAKLELQGDQSHHARQGMFHQSEITVPEIALGDARADITIEDGHLDITEVATTSSDGELYVTGEISMRDPVMQSEFPGCVRFRLTDAFEEREPGFGNTNLWMPRTALGEDGFYSIPLRGTLEDLGVDPRRTCDGETAEPGDGVAQAGERRRPEVTIRPDDESGAGERRRPSVVVGEDGDEDDEESDRDLAEDADDAEDEDLDTPFEETDDERTERASQRERLEAMGADETEDGDRGARGGRGDDDGDARDDSDDEHIDDQDADDQYADDQYADDDYDEYDDEYDDEYPDDDYDDYDDDYPDEGSEDW